MRSIMYFPMITTRKKKALFSGRRNEIQLFTLLCSHVIGVDTLFIWEALLHARFKVIYVGFCVARYEMASISRDMREVVPL